MLLHLDDGVGVKLFLLPITIAKFLLKVKQIMRSFLDRKICGVFSWLAVVLEIEAISNPNAFVHVVMSMTAVVYCQPIS